MKLVLQVWHQDAYKMVGKVFEVPWAGKERCLIFLHEESGNQGHRNLSAPGGIDACLRDDLINWGVEQLHHYNRTTKILYQSGLINFLTNGQRQKSGGRDRIFLPERYWTKAYMQAKLPYAVPWIRDVKQYGGRAEGVQLGLPGLEG